MKNSEWLSFVIITFFMTLVSSFYSIFIVLKVLGIIVASWWWLLAPLAAIIVFPAFLFFAALLVFSVWTGMKAVCSKSRACPGK